MADHPLDTVSLEIDTPAPGDRRDAVGSRRDERSDAARDEVVANGSALLSIVVQQKIRLGVGQLHQVAERRTVGRFAALEVECERDAGGIGDNKLDR